MVVCPFEAIKVRVQTQPMFAKGLLDGFPKVIIEMKVLLGDSSSKNHLQSLCVIFESLIISPNAASTWDFFGSGVAIFHVILLHQLDFILV